MQSTKVLSHALAHKPSDTPSHIHPPSFSLSFSYPSLLFVPTSSRTPSHVHKGHTHVCLRLLDMAKELLPVEGPQILARSLNMPERNTPFHALFLRSLTEDLPGSTPAPFYLVDSRLFVPLLSIYPQASIIRNNRGETPLSLHVRFDEFYRCFQVIPLLHSLYRYIYLTS